jgi:type IX secretion system PorP/SprF family membrane protein
MEKMNKIKALFALTLMLTFSSYKAQYDAMFTQYMFNEVFINPAYAGSKEAMSATLLHRQQWVNVPGRPVTTSFALHGPIMGNKMGAGLSVLSEKIGVLRRTLFYGNYAYRLKIDENNTIALGLVAGLDNQVNDFQKLNINDVSSGAQIDPQFAGTPSALAGNFGTGIFYSNKKAYAGISIPRLLDNEVRLNNSGSTVKTTRLSASKFTYYITGGYVFDFNDELKMRASGMLKMVKNAPPQMDIAANFLINNIIWAGLSYRTKSSISSIVGMQVNKQLLVSYSYDFDLNALRPRSKGSHEFVLNYLFSFSGKKIITPRYF